MDTILDYIRWRGDIPLAEDGLRDADALVLGLLTYLDLKPVWQEGGEPLYLRDCRRMAEEGTLRVLITGKDMGYEEIITRAIASRRFGDLLITDYVDEVRDEPPLQFAALCFHDESGLSVLGYRGTDDTLVGWEEDFMIGVTRTESQELALRYADAHLKTGRRWVLCGHSKGGNLALFAASRLSDAVLESVERIYLLDSPGLCPEVMDVSATERIDGLCTRIIPSFSVIGKLFEPQITDSRIVRSSGSGMLQHSLATWGIDHGELDRCEENDPRSRWLNAAVKEWIGNISQEDRVVFIRELFGALSATGAHRVDELDSAGPAGFETIFRRLLESSEVTKRTISDLPRQAVNQAVNAATQAVSAAGQAVSGLRQRLSGGEETSRQENSCY